MSSVVPDWRILRDAGYFPPTDDAFGRPGFTTVLMAIHRPWGAESQEIIDQGDRVRAGNRTHSAMALLLVGPEWTHPWCTDCHASGIVG